MRSWFVMIGGAIMFILFLGMTSAQSPTPEPYPLEIPFQVRPGFRIPPDNPLTYEGIELGRILFYEKKLSHDNTISCSNCHQQRFAFSDGMAFGNGVRGAKTKRSSMSLANLLWKFKFFWDGRLFLRGTGALSNTRLP